MTQITTINDNDVRIIKTSFISIPIRAVPAAMKI
jgi:hypothetical protein